MLNLKFAVVNGFDGDELFCEHIKDYTSYIYKKFAVAVSNGDYKAYYKVSRHEFLIGSYNAFHSVVNCLSNFGISYRVDNDMVIFYIET